MKHPSLVLLITCLWCWAPLVQLRAIPLTVFLGGSPPSGSAYTINETFEGTGAPSGWTAFGSSADFDEATVFFAGAQSFQVGDASSGAYYTIPDANSYTLDFMFRTDATPGGTRNLIGIRDSAAAPICLVRISSTSKFTVYTNGADSSGTSLGFSNNTWYYVRMIWTDGGTCSVEFNSTGFGSMDGSGADYASRTGGTTTDATRFYIGATSNAHSNSYIDNVQLY